MPSTYPSAIAASRQAPVSRADPSALRYRSRRVPPWLPLPSEQFNATLVEALLSCLARSRSCTSITASTGRNPLRTSRITEYMRNMFMAPSAPPLSRGAHPPARSGGVVKDAKHRCFCSGDALLRVVLDDAEHRATMGKPERAGSSPACILCGAGAGAGAGADAGADAGAGAALTGATSDTSTPTSTLDRRRLTQYRPKSPSGPT
jgi:hypothetical protein